MSPARRRGAKGAKKAARQGGGVVERPQLVPVSKLRESQHNPRRTYGDLSELAKSIVAQGILQPLVARRTPQGLELVFGHRRLRAAKLAGLREVPILLREMSDEGALEAQLVENSQRTDIHPMEEAEGYERLMSQYGYKADDVAAKVGKSRAFVYGRLKLLALVPDARRAFYAGGLDASTALLVARLQGERLQRRAVEELTKLGLSYRKAVEHLHKRFGVEASKAKKPTRETAKEVAQRRERVTLAALSRAVATLEQKGDLETPELRMMAMALPADRTVLRRRGWDSTEAMENAIPKLHATQLRALVFELGVAPWLMRGATGNDYSPNLKAFAKAFGVSLEEIEEGVEGAGE